MPNKSISRNVDATNSGQGAVGMGGQPEDNPRDLPGGHEDLVDDDRPRTVPGASGNPRIGDPSGGAVAGVKGDRAVSEAITGQHDR